MKSLWEEKNTKLNWKEADSRAPCPASGRALHSEWLRFWEALDHPLMDLICPPKYWTILTTNIIPYCLLYLPKHVTTPGAGMPDAYNTHQTGSPDTSLQQLSPKLCLCYTCIYSLLLLTPFLHAGQWWGTTTLKQECGQNSAPKPFLTSPNVSCQNVSFSAWCDGGHVLL